MRCCVLSAPCSGPAAGSSSWPARWAHSATWTLACSRCSDGATLEEVEAAVESWRTAIHNGTAEEQGWPRWINVPSKVAQVAAVRAVAAQRRAADLAEGTLVAAVCPGLVDTRASRPWFDDYSRAQTPEQATRAVLDLILAGRPDPATYGELIQFGQVLPWHSGTPFPSQDQMLSR